MKNNTDVIADTLVDVGTSALKGAMLGWAISWLLLSIPVVIAVVAFLVYLI